MVIPQSFFLKPYLFCTCLASFPAFASSPSFSNWGFPCIISGFANMRDKLLPSSRLNKHIKNQVNFSNNGYKNVIKTLKKSSTLRKVGKIYISSKGTVNHQSFFLKLYLFCRYSTSFPASASFVSIWGFSCIILGSAGARDELLPSSRLNKLTKNHVNSSYYKYKKKCHKNPKI